MRKIIVLVVLVFVCGCSSVTGGSKKGVVIKGEISCTTEDSKFSLFLENGQIVRYVDSVDGDLGQETVSILNEEHLVGVTDNDVALKIMDNALKDLSGHCEEVLVEK